MNNPGFEFINERDTLVLCQNDGLYLAVVQIASFLARTIQSYVVSKNMVDQGERIGMIRFGSQVDVAIFTQDVTLLVEEGDRVYAGMTRIAEK